MYLEITQPLVPIKVDQLMVIGDEVEGGGGGGIHISGDWCFVDLMDKAATGYVTISVPVVW